MPAPYPQPACVSPFTFAAPSAAADAAFVSGIPRSLARSLSELVVCLEVTLPADSAAGGVDCGPLLATAAAATGDPLTEDAAAVTAAWAAGVADGGRHGGYVRVDTCASRWSMGGYRCVSPRSLHGALERDRRTAARAPVPPPPWGGAVSGD